MTTTDNSKPGIPFLAADYENAFPHFASKQHNTLSDPSCMIDRNTAPNNRT